MSRLKPAPRVLEKAEQTAIVRLLHTLGARVYVIGTTRKRGDYPGTMQTPGLPDLLAFLPELERPPARLRSLFARRQVWIEVKTTRGRRSPAQQDFSRQCLLAHVDYICGPLDAVIGWLTREGYLVAEHGEVPSYRVPPVVEAG